MDDFTASTEAELRLFSPMVTDFMIVVKRSQVGKPQPFNTRDDVVWRGHLTNRWLEANSNIVGHFGDVDLTFEVVGY